MWPNLPRDSPWKERQEKESEISQAAREVLLSLARPSRPLAMPQRARSRSQTANRSDFKVARDGRRKS